MVLLGCLLIFFNLVGIIGGALVIRLPKISGIMMLVSTVGGLVLITKVYTLVLIPKAYIIAFIFLLAGGILAFCSSTTKTISSM